MSRLQARFEALRKAGRKALIPYIMAGDPTREITVPLLHALVEAGSDVIELGMPFSDPMADGPVVQRAGERALKNGISALDALGFVAEFRKKDAETPVVLMGYANSIESLGLERFVREAKAAGLDGVIVVDYPPEECAEFAALAKKSGIDPVFLLAPTSTEERIRQVARVASGYLYYVSLKGITGAGHLDISDVAAHLPKLRAATKLPIGVGFGIRDAASARKIAEIADGVVIGSRIIQEIEAGPPSEAPARVKSFLKPIRAAIDGLGQKAIA